MVWKGLAALELFAGILFMRWFYMKCSVFKKRNQWTPNVTIPQVRSFAALRKKVTGSLHFDFIQYSYDMTIGTCLKRITKKINKRLPRSLRLPVSKGKKGQQQQHSSKHSKQQVIAMTDFEHATFLEASLALCFNGDHVTGSYTPIEEGVNDQFASYFSK